LLKKPTGEQEDKVLVYTFQQFKPYERNHHTHDLELAIMVVALKF